MKKSAFTMIELVFVIVVLGILAAVAVPRLAATRDDAEAVAALSSFKTAIKNIRSSVATQGTIPANLMTVVRITGNVVPLLQTVTVNVRGQNCAQAQIVGRILIVNTISTANNCAVFVNLPTGNIALDGQSINF